MQLPLTGMKDALKPASAFELCMRHKAFFSEGVGVPPLVITGWIEFDNPIKKDDVKDAMMRWIPSYRRFGAVSMPDGSWLEVSDLDWDYHVVTLPTFKAEQERTDFIDSMVNEELDMNKPLWRVYCMELGYAKKGQAKGTHLKICTYSCILTC